MTRVQAKPRAARARRRPDRAAELRETNARLAERVRTLEQSLRKRDEQRRALLHMMGDLNTANARLADQRKAMIHIMRDLHETTAEMQRREQELRDKQEQLVQAGKLATLGELTTGVAHELNNPLNNIGLFVGNVIDEIGLGVIDTARCLGELRAAMEQVRKATEIISHLRTFGRAAPVSRGPVAVNRVLERALALMHEQMRLRQIRVELQLGSDDPFVMGNAIQLEQVCVNLLTNARDAVADSPRRVIQVACEGSPEAVTLSFGDTGTGIPSGIEQRIFDPFFTTKAVGAGTGLGLSITYSIIKDHQGTIRVHNRPGEGATFVIELPRERAASHEPRP